MKTKLLNLFTEYLERQDALSKLTENEKVREYRYSEIHTIAAIGNLEEPNVTEISRRMKMTKGAISKIIKKLQASGAIETYQVDGNKQKVFYSLTDKGQFLYEEHDKSHNLWIKRDQEFLDKYSEEQLDFIASFMMDYISYMDEQIDRIESNKNKLTK